MATRKPLVVSSGLQQELPAGDISQIYGDLAALDNFAGTAGNVAEIEATRALRGSLWPMGDNGEDFCMSRHAMGFQLSHVATTTFLANSEILTLMNLGTLPIAIRRIGMSVATSALTGARAGLARVCGLQLFACAATSGVAFLFNPPIGQAVNFGGHSSGLLTRQNVPTLLIGSSQNTLVPNGIPGFTAVVSGGRSIGEATGGAGAAVGTNIKPCWLYDSYGEEPFWLMPTMGLYLNSTFPAAGTSQTINYGVTLLWDEWQPRTPR